MGEPAARAGGGRRPGPAGRPARRVRAEPLSAEAWAPFGWLPVENTDELDRSHRLVFEWGDPHLNVISHHPDEVRRHGELLRCSDMFRHDSHTQALVVLDVPAVIAVARAATRFERPDDAEAVRAFVLEPMDCVVLGRGTWHWGPYPLGLCPVRLLNVQGLRYRQDNTRADLEAVGAAVDVEAPGGGASP
jgi:ureidoglycolate hydrolase